MRLRLLDTRHPTCRQGGGCVLRHPTGTPDSGFVMITKLSWLQTCNGFKLVLILNMQFLYQPTNFFWHGICIMQIVCQKRKFPLCQVWHRICNPYCIVSHRTGNRKPEFRTETYCKAFCLKPEKRLDKLNCICYLIIAGAGTVRGTGSLQTQYLKSVCLVL